jgi:hypothetical protein
MRKMLPGLVLSGALLLGACGGPAVNDAANQAATEIANPTNQADAAAAVDAAATELANPTTQADLSAVADEAGTQLANPTTQAALNEAATVVTGPDAATAVADAAGTLSAVADDVTLQQGEALVLDATQSAGNVADYKWTVTTAPAGAESVVGQVITENSNGNVSLEPADYAKYFPVVGDYTVRLTVTDTAGATSNDDFTIAVP